MAPAVTTNPPGWVEVTRPVTSRVEVVTNPALSVVVQVVPPAPDLWRRCTVVRPIAVRRVTSRSETSPDSRGSAERINSW